MKATQKLHVGCIFLLLKWLVTLKCLLCIVRHTLVCFIHKLFKYVSMEETINVLFICYFFI